MATLMKTEYNQAGELREPVLLAPQVLSLRNRVKGRPTWDRGHFHYFEFRATDEFQLHRKLTRFVELLGENGAEVIVYEDGPVPAIPGHDNGVMARVTYVVR